MLFYLQHYLPFVQSFDRAHGSQEHFGWNTDKVHSVPGVGFTPGNVCSILSYFESKYEAKNSRNKRSLKNRLANLVFSSSQLLVLQCFDPSKSFLRLFHSITVRESALRGFLWSGSGKSVTLIHGFIPTTHKHQSAIFNIFNMVVLQMATTDGGSPAMHSKAISWVYTISISEVKYTIKEHLENV